MHILVTLLGDPRFNSDGSYEETIYKFEDGIESQLTSYSSLAIKSKIKPNKVVVLGTTKSNWHSFFKYFFIKNNLEQKLNDFRSLIETLKSEHTKDAVRQESLDQASIILSKSDIEKSDFELRLIPYGRNQSEQTHTLEVMMNSFNNGDEATLDVSYGLRHLPMLMQQSALLLQSLKGVKINNIFYGAFHIAKNNITPILALDGLLEIDRWTKAFHQYEQDGNYSAFKEPLKYEGINQVAVNALQDAAYFERTFNLTEAGKKLDDVKKNLPEKFDGIGEFFTEKFKSHIEWSDNSDLKKRQSELAHFYLKQGDFVRASIFGVESYITSLFKLPNEISSIQDYKFRESVEKDFFAKKRGKQGIVDCYKDLKSIRNTLAHGTEPSMDIVKIMSNPKLLKERIELLFHKLGIKP